MLPGSIHVTVCTSTSLLFIARYSPIVCTDHMCLSIHQLMDIWVVPPFGLYYYELVCTNCVDTYFQFPGYVCRNEPMVHIYDNFMFDTEKLPNDLPQQHTIFHSSVGFDFFGYFRLGDLWRQIQHVHRHRQGAVAPMPAPDPQSPPQRQPRPPASQVRATCVHSVTPVSSNSLRPRGL